MILKIVLSEPIPPEGRIPTTAEIRQFIKFNTGMRPTRSGAWTISWYEEKDGTKTATINYFDKKSCSGARWEIEAIEPELKPKKEPRLPAPLPLVRSKSTAIVWDF